MKYKIKQKKIYQKISSFLVLFFIFFIFLGIFKKAYAETCKKPVDVILVMDNSANMNGKSGTVRTASKDFIFKEGTPSSGLFSITPNANLAGNNHHKIGLVSYNNNVNISGLTKIYDDIKNDIDDLVAPNSSSKLSLAINLAKNDLVTNTENPEAEKIMIILIGSAPKDFNKTNNSLIGAKNKGIRIIGIGLDLDDLEDKASAEGVITNDAILPADCYYASDTGNTLDGCNSIDSTSLKTALNNIYGDITDSVCDTQPPSISILRNPTGTLYAVQKLKIISTATDDVGFQNHSIAWSDDWDDHQFTNNTPCNLVGTSINCDTGDIGPFSFGTTIEYKSSATDVNNNYVNIDPRKTVKVATTSLNVPILFKKQNNEITINIKDPSASANADEFWIKVKDETGELVNSQMTNCFGSGSDWSCKYNLNPGCNVDSSLDISVYVKSGENLLFSPIEDSSGNSLFLGSENVLSGNCSDGIDNDCDHKIDSEEPLSCDDTDPTVSIERTIPNEINEEVYDNTNNITLKSIAYDPIGIKENIIYYKKETDSSWTTAFDCKDSDGDGKCDADLNKNIISFEILINSIFPAGTTIKYYAKAIDNNDNTKETTVKDFVVKSFECDGIANLGICSSGSGQCCDGVCNKNAINTGIYKLLNTSSCAQKVCNETSLEWVADTTKNNTLCSEDGNVDGCFEYTPLILANPVNIPSNYIYNSNGCEERAYRCDNGYCNYGISGTRKEDGCDIFNDPVKFKDFGCNAGSCEKLNDWEDSVCDNTVSFANLIVEDKSGQIMTGESEVLDSKTKKIKIIAKVSDPSGIKRYKIFWKVNGGVWQNKDCGSCGKNNTCSCEKKIGPFVQGDFVNYYMWAQDNSPNTNESYNGFGNGLNYDYYTYDSSDEDEQGTFKGSSIDENLDHFWSGNISVKDKAWEDQENAAIVWEGFIIPDEIGTYNFYVYSDDGIKLYIGDEKIIDEWSYSSNEYSAVYSFSSLNPVPIKIKWYDHGGYAKMRLGWKSPSGSKVYPIPNTNLMAAYTFEVKNNKCYEIAPDYSIKANKENLSEPDGLGNGICCDGYFDSSPSTTFFDSECRENACGGVKGINWIYQVANETNPCGESGCFGYYNGCYDQRNICSSGKCIVNPDVVKIDSCSTELNSESKLKNDFSCSEGNCSDSIAIGNEIECSSSGNHDKDDVSCNCDCDGYDVKERVYSSLSFNGVDDYVQINDNSSLDIPIQSTGDITMEAWIYPLNLSKTMGIISKGSNYRMLLLTGGELKFQSYGWVGSGDLKVNINEWSHVVITYNSTSRDLIFYVNGKNKIISNYSVNGGMNSGDLFLGRDGDLHFNGFIDDVRIYSRALYPEEIMDHYKGMFLDDSDLVGHWNFDEETGEIVSDSANNNNGELSNIDGTLVSWSPNPKLSSGKYGKGLEFNGGYVKTNSFSIPNNNNVITFSAWLKNNEKSKKIQTLISDGSQSNSVGFIWLYRGYNNDYLRWQYSTGTSYSYFTSSSDFLTGYDDQWIFITVIVDYENKKAKFYRNGELINTATTTRNMKYPDINRTKYIGAYNSTSHKFNGFIDEVRIYNQSFSDADIKEQFKGFFKDNSNLVGYWSFNKLSGSTVFDSSENSPKWISYGNGDDKDDNGNTVNVSNRKVPEPWQVCTDKKDNDCDTTVDEYNLTDSQCDDEVKIVSIKASIKDVNGNFQTLGTPFSEVYDVNIKNTSNNFTLSAVNYDEFGIRKTIIQWTADNWANIEEYSCENEGACEVCVKGGSCSGDKIDKKLLGPEKVFQYRTCAWDNSNRNNQKCTDNYGIEVLYHNQKPSVNNLLVIDPDFCNDGLRYVLDWDFQDGDVLDIQNLYQIQIKKGNNNFKEGPFVVNIEKNSSDSAYMFVPGEHVVSGTVTKASPNKLNSSGSSWVKNEWKGGTVEIIGGTGDGQKRKISSNKVDELTIDLSWKKIPDNTSLYKITGGFDLEYNKEYYWRVRVADNGTPSRISGWVKGPSFSTPEHIYPAVDFSVHPINTSVDPPVEDTSKRCDYETNDTSIHKCSFGEDLIFHDESILVECNNSDDCLLIEKSKCSDEKFCVECTKDLQCNKFNNSNGGVKYSCNSGKCEATINFCNADSDCKTANFAKCDSSQCVQCDNDSQCNKFNNKSFDYECNDGKCEYKNRRSWDFYGDGLEDSKSSDPINNYIESTENLYYVTLTATDILKKECSKTKKIPFIGDKYPKWNEVFLSD